MLQEVVQCLGVLITDAFVDEIPGAYKDIDQVMADAADLVEVRHTLRQIINVKGAGELTVFCGALIGAAVGFLWFNCHPAQVFMGDAGSLALGGAIGMLAVLTKAELLLPLIGGLYVVEAGSVIIQVVSFKLTGRRVFKMAPLHHHYELTGWSEPKIVVRFWIVSFALALLALTTLKLR